MRAPYSPCTARRVFRPPSPAVALHSSWTGSAQTLFDVAQMRLVESSIMENQDCFKIQILGVGPDRAVDRAVSCLMVRVLPTDGEPTGRLTTDHWAGRGARMARAPAAVLPAQRAERGPRPHRGARGPPRAVLCMVELSMIDTHSLKT